MRFKISFVCFSLFYFLLFSLYNYTPVSAAGFNLKSISGVNTDGKIYSRWYYTGLQPTFSGEAPGSSAVDIIIDGQSYQTAANAAGEWQFTVPAALTAGDHTVVLKNNGSEINFTLTLGKENVNWDEISQGGGETLPTVGIISPTIISLLGGLSLIGLAANRFYLFEKK